MSTHHVYWGDTHHNLFVSSDRGSVDVAAVCAEARKHLDFLVPAYYTALDAPWRPELNAPGKSGITLESWKPAGLLAAEWAQIQEATRVANEDGAFVTFPGYEWQGDGSGGDHNVFCREEGHAIHAVDTLPELYARLRGERAYAIPHHTAYRAGHRGRDWSIVDQTITPFSEIFSCHGGSETDEEWVGMRNNPQMGPNLAGGTYQDALNRGLRLGAICSTDNFGASKLSGRFGYGLMACLAPELTRASLWEAFGARRVYGVTGDRIELRFTVNDQPMGSVVSGAGLRRVRVSATGQDAIDRIEVLRNDRVIATHCHQGAWAAPRPGQAARMRFRIECGWGPGHQRLDVPDREWQGELHLSAGRFVGFAPCWICAGQARPALDGGRARFALRTRSTQVRERWQNANVFEVEARPEDMLHVRIGGLEDSFRLADLLVGSRGLYDRAGAVALLEQARGLTPAQAGREDIFYHCAHKVKLHRAIPEAGYTARLEFDDDEPLAGESHYRVRVEQRNGQRAWSSPIWVRG